MAQERRRRLFRLVLRDGAVSSLYGGSLGVAGALAGSRLLKSFLYGITTYDFVSFLLPTLILTFVTAVAAYLPARRAAKLDPLHALRYE